MVHVLVVSSLPECLEKESIHKLLTENGFLIDGASHSIEKVERVRLRSRSVKDGKLSCKEHTAAFLAAEKQISNFLSANDVDVVHDRFIGILYLPQTSDRSCYHPDDIHPLTWPEGALVLAFPEIQWIPVYGTEGGTNGTCANDSEGIMTLHRALSLSEGGYSPLFDGDGLRSMLMLRVHNDEKHENAASAVENEVGTKAGGRCARADVALAVDEETNFACMNAYTAYRFGYRAYPVTTLSAANNLLKGEPGQLPLTFGIRNFSNPPSRTEEFRNRIINPAIVVFEDVQLSFPDAESGKADADAPEFGDRRDEAYPLLNSANLRVVATASLPQEKMAKTKGKTKATAEENFREKENKRKEQYRPLQGAAWRGRMRFMRHRAIERLKRRWFNASGAWAGHWFVKMLDTVLMAGVLLGVLFLKVSLFLPVLFGLFVLQGLLRYTLRMLSSRKGLLPEWARMYCVRRAQWRFLPKRYRNHCPENQVGKVRDTFWTITHKPLAGIFGLRNESCLPNGYGYKGIYDTAQVKEQYRLARQGDFGDPDVSKHGEGISHAAPGMAMEIAKCLLRRAERLEVEDKIIDSEGAVHGAVLATVAGELLDAKTPALSIEALTLKQCFEIKAECEFVGVRAHTDMVDRYIDIHNAMGRICRTSNGLVREDVFTSGMAELMDKLSSLLAEKGKKEEALFFEKKARMFHRRLMNPMARNLLAYPEWLLRSAWHVVVGLMVLVAVFCAFWMFEIKPFDVSVPATNVSTTHAEARRCGECAECCAPTSPIIHSRDNNHSAVSYAYELLFCDEPNFTDERWCDYSLVLRTMRLIAMLHLAFLGLCFWDVMRKK